MNNQLQSEMFHQLFLFSKQLVDLKQKTMFCYFQTNDREDTPFENWSGIWTNYLFFW
jgi:hypothetical protein